MPTAKKKTSDPKVSKASIPQVKEDSIKEEKPTDEEYSSPNDVQTYLSWHAPGRPFKYHAKEYFINAGLIALAIEIILFFVSMYLLMVVVASLVFLSFALSSVPPRMFYYKITSEGIRIEDHFFIWDELYDFYFMKYHGQDVMHIRTRSFFPGELMITLGEVPVEQVKAVVISFLPYREYVKPTFMEKAGTWLELNFPLEKTTP
jgi:hypothetical protein